MPVRSSCGSVPRTRTGCSTPRRSTRSWKLIARSRRIDMRRVLASAGIVLLVATSAVAAQDLTIDWSRTVVIAGPRYVVSGEVRYQDVEGQGYLEMWTVFPDGQRFFSRTLDAQGPRAALRGESNWRRFELPFDMSGASQAPSRLEINLVLPGRGAVWAGRVASCSAC